MPRDTTVIAFRQPEAIDDPLTEVAREGARRMLAQVLIAEADSFIAMWKDLRLPDGRDRIVPSRPWPASRNPDRDWACRGPSRQGARPGRRGRGGRRVSMRCCRFSTFVGCRPATSRRCSPPCWGRTRRTSCPR